MQAVLLIGFHEHEVQAFRGIMLDMDADMVKVKYYDSHTICSGQCAMDMQ